MNIDNYHNTYNYECGESLIEDDPQSLKISIINNQINDVKNDIKENNKNMMNNMSDMNQIEGKSVSIKDTSFQFQRDWKNKIWINEKDAVRNKIALFITFTALLMLVIYILVK